MLPLKPCAELAGRQHHENQPEKGQQLHLLDPFPPCHQESVPQT